MKTIPIRYKLTMLITGLMILFFSILLFSTTSIMDKHITDGMIADTEDIIELVANKFDKTILEASNTLETMVTTSQYEGLDEQLYSEFIASLPELDTDLLNIFMFYDNGTYLLYPKTTLPMDFDYKSSDWYIGAIETSPDFFWTEPYFDSVSDTMVITAAKAGIPSSLDESTSFGIDIQLKELSNFLNKYQINDNGYMMLITDSGMVIAHKEATLNNVLLPELDDDLLTFFNGNDHLLKSNKGVYLKRKVALDYNLVAFISGEDIHKITSIISAIYALILLMFLIFTSITIFFVVKRITKPLEELMETMEHSLDANLLLLSDIKTNDEINNLINGYNEMATQINEKNLEMSALYEELYASEETLKEQYDQLYDSREELKIREEKYRLIFESSSEGLWEQRPDNTLRLYTSSWYNQFDIDLDNATFDLWLKLIHPEDQEQFHLNVTNQTSNNKSVFLSEYRIMTKSGEYMWIASLGRLLFNGDGSIKTMIGAHQDITSRKRNEEQIAQLAFYDSLTHLHNRFSFKDKIIHRLETGEKLALLYIDLDNFKYINDTYGHNYGDKVLMAIAERLKSTCRTSSIISRISGDEFGIALTDYKDDEDLRRHTEVILSIINQKMVIDNLEFFTSASIGISQFPKDADTFDELMVNADMSMYEAKDADKNGYFFFTSSMKDAMINKIRIENRLLNSIEKEELYLMYQPIINLETQTIKGFESLIRWEDTDYGPIYPDQFIPIAEHNKFIKQIGLFVLRETLKTGQLLKEKMGMYFDMSINVSVVQLQDNEFLNSTKTILKETPYPTEHITFEITESVTIESDSRIIRRLNQFKSMGIKISLDDFGTGYSSLNNLLELPLDLLKIDRSLLARSTTFEEVSTFITSITTIARTLGIKVVSEGIENKDTLEIAEQHKADYVQGYMFSKPMKYDAMEDYINNFKFD